MNQFNFEFWIFFNILFTDSINFNFENNMIFQKFSNFKPNLFYALIFFKIEKKKSISFL